MDHAGRLATRAIEVTMEVSEDGAVELEGHSHMRSIETTAIVTDDGILTVELPRDIPAGQHRVVVVIDEEPVPIRQRGLLDFPTDDLGPWPEHLSLRREDMYGEWGR